MVCCALLKWLRRSSKKKNDDDTIGYVPAHSHQAHTVPAIEGLSESIHLLLAYGNSSHEDITFKHILPSEGDAELIGGQPLLEVHKKRYTQSTAISRYLGKQFGLAGADPFEDLEIDQIVEVFNDFRIKLVAVQCEIDTEVRQKKLDTFRKEAPQYLAKFDAVIAANDGHLALGKLTWADFVVTGLWHVVKSVLNQPDVDQRYPNMSGMVRTVLSMPGVASVRQSIDKPNT